jgi:hypothetical protein
MPQHGGRYRRRFQFGSSGLDFADIAVVHPFQDAHDIVGHTARQSQYVDTFNDGNEGTQRMTVQQPDPR